ncbi:MAG: AmmeMemoRadiSam system protein B [Armatimonadetes bacterium]|nr:AmmeMemoRadiSam system protein B [Armatimonadota bacterium]
MKHLVPRQPSSSAGACPLRLFPLAVALAMVLLVVGCERPAAQSSQGEASSASAGRAVASAASATESEAPGEAEGPVRAPAVAGMFYPADAGRLREQIQHDLDAASPPKVPGRVLAVIAPHAGYEFSGAVAAHAYRVVRGRHYDTVVLLGPSHHVYCPGAALPETETWRTPLGKVKVDHDVAEALLKAAPDTFRRDDGPHAREHSLEMQLIFLQVALKGFRIVPLMTTDFSPENCDKIADALAKVLKGRNALMAVSTDLAPYPPSDLCSRVDHKTLDHVVHFDYDAIYRWEREATHNPDWPQVECTMCGLGPVVAALKASRALGADRVVLLKYSNSGLVNSLTADRSVGYGALAVCASKLSPAPEEQASEAAGGGEAATSSPRTPASDKQTKTEGKGEGKMQSAAPGTPDNLTDEQKKRLLKLARQAIEKWVVEALKIPAPTDDPAFREPRAVFVTLKKHGRLRGCIGTLEPVAPLGEAVVESAISAATRDPRFMRVGPDEVDDLEIEVSVLSPLRPVKSPDEIVLGKHGIVVRQGLRSGVFLPEVAPEQGWDLETTLTILCTEKAGLPGDAWKHGAELLVFTTQSFDEKEYGLGPYAR